MNGDYICIQVLEMIVFRDSWFFPPLTHTNSNDDATYGLLVCWIQASLPNSYIDSNTHLK